MSLKIPYQPHYFVVTTAAERNTKWHDGSIAWVTDDSKLYVLDTGSFVEVTSGLGTGSMTTVKEAGVQVGGTDIVTLDFGAGFDVSESPNTECNITLDFSEVAGHDNFTDFVANEHIDWTSTSSNFSTSGTLGCGAATATSVNVPEISNTSGDFKIEPDVQGDVYVFGDTDVGDASHGKAFYVYRKAAEGDNSIKLYITSTKQAIINADTTLYLNHWSSGSVSLFEGSDVGDGSDGRSLQIHRKAAEGDTYIKLYVDDTKQPIVNMNGTDGWTGTFTNGDAATVTVSGGVITNVA